nr:MAG TPA: hypothetical protein [Bacteriophage sp.]
MWQKCKTREKPRVYTNYLQRNLQKVIDIHGKMVYNKDTR